jgi:hypothetical protein
MGKYIPILDVYLTSDQIAAHQRMIKETEEEIPKAVISSQAAREWLEDLERRGFRPPTSEHDRSGAVWQGAADDVLATSQQVVQLREHFDYLKSLPI